MIEERYFLPTHVLPPNFHYPKAYIDFVDQQRPRGVAMIGMPPWVFAGNLIWALDESRSLFDTTLIPFAQAENLDMVAFFKCSDGDTISVWNANPWEQLPDYRIYCKYPNFDSWLSAAQSISSEFLSNKPHFAKKEFWFPKTK